MRNYWIVLHAYGAFLIYCSLGVLAYWFFNIHVPEIKGDIFAVFAAIGAMIIQPILSYICLKYGKSSFNKIMGFIYLILWISNVTRFFLLFN